MLALGTPPWTPRSARASHAVATPVSISTAAILIREAEPTVVNWPPTYNVFWKARRTLTTGDTIVTEVIDGFQASSWPEPSWNEARRDRVWPAATPKKPPTKSRPPAMATASTEASIPGFHEETAPLAASTEPR